jgi:hypothetical protein
MSVDFQLGPINITSDGSVPASGGYVHEGGRVSYAAQGDFGGGSTTLNFSLDGGTTWSSVGSNAALSASGGGGAELPPCLVRVTLASSTSPDLDISIAHTGGDRMSG